MKVVFAVLFVACGPLVSRAGPAEMALLAAMKLSEQPNYSWTSSVSDDARDYDIDGKTDSSGYTWLSLPLTKALGKRMGRLSESRVETVFRGPNACVIRTDAGWLTFRELDRWRRHDEDEQWSRSLQAASDAWETAPLGGSPLPVLPPPLDDDDDDDDKGPYCNAQFALVHPHEDLAIVVSSCSDVKVEGDEACGTLGDTGARLLLVHEGLETVHPLAAAGTFILHIKDGIVTNYTLDLEGVLMVKRKKILVHQKSCTWIRDIGTTKLEVPDVVQRKLGG